MDEKCFAELAIVFAEFDVIPQIAISSSIGEIEAAPWNSDARGKRVQVEQSDIIASVSKIGDPHWSVTSECLCRRVAGLIHGEYLVIAQNLFAKVVESGQITAQIHRRVGHRPQCGDG